MRPPSSSRAARAVVLAALVLAPAGSPRAQAPAPAPPLAERFTLPNGLVVLVAERHALPIVTVRVSVGAGTVLDPSDKPGLANLTALTLSLGTPARTAFEIDRAIEFVGGSLDAEGDRDWSELAVSVLRKDLGLGLDLLADVLLRPTFPADEVERKREEVKASVRKAEEDPETVAARVFRKLIFPGHPYSSPVAGTEESLGRITREDVVAFYRAAYRPETTAVVVVGDVTVAEVRDALAARLGGWRNPDTPPVAPGMVTLGAPARTEMVPRDLRQATVFLGQATVTRPHPDHYPLLVASQILGGGSTSRLYSRVREERGLAYSVFAQYGPGRYGGLMLVGFQSENARVREVLTLVREELVRLRREPVTGEELARAKAYLVGSFPLRMDTNAELATLLLAVERFGLGLDYPARYRQAVQAVTAEDVHRAVRAHWDPDLTSLAIVANLREAGMSAP
jgi:zinc protease